VACRLMMLQVVVVIRNFVNSVANANKAANADVNNLHRHTQIKKVGTFVSTFLYYIALFIFRYDIFYEYL